MAAAGFREVSARLFTVAVRAESPEEYLESTERSGLPLSAMRKKLTPEAWADAHARLLAAVRRSIPAGGADLTAEAIITRGVR